VAVLRVAEDQGLAEVRLSTKNIRSNRLKVVRKVVAVLRVAEDQGLAEEVRLSKNIRSNRLKVVRKAEGAKRNPRQRPVHINQKTNESAIVSGLHRGRLVRCRQRAPSARNLGEITERHDQAVKGPGE